MLVATPGQTTSYSTLHNNSSNGGGSNNSAATTSTNKKSSTLNSSNTTSSGTVKSLSNNTNHSTSTVTTKKSLNSNAQSTTFNHQNSKNDTVSNNLCSQNKSTAASSREIISSAVTSATTHSFKNENSTNSTNTTNTKQSFIQTLKDSVQKALISTTGSISKNSIANKYATDNKLQTDFNNSTTSTHNVTSSSSTTSHNLNKVSTTTSSNTFTGANHSSTSAAVVRSKHFSCSLSKLHTVAPTVIHRHPEERQHAGSTDSLQKEMCHFKPIRIVPKTPWKSGSKSRGNFLRFPKANLATKKSEFVLKSNCDVNNRKRKKQQNQTQNDKINVNEDEDDDNEQENKEIHGIYKPKPSLTCLSTSVTTPNHPSAFVCLVAPMKDLVNLKLKRRLTPEDLAPGIPLTELFMRKKQKPAKKQQTEQDLPKIRSARLTSNAVKNKRISNKKTTQQASAKENVKRTKAKLNRISKTTAGAISKANTRRKLVRDKSKIINIVELATTKAKEKLKNSASMPSFSSNKSKTIAVENKSTRKRKVAQDDLNDIHQNHLLPTASITPSPKNSVSSKSLALRTRKSYRLPTKDMSVTTSTLLKHPTNINSQKTISSRNSRKNTTSSGCFSPPLTRSRLKNLAEQGKIIATTTVNNKKRKI